MGVLLNLPKSCSAHHIHSHVTKPAPDINDLPGVSNAAQALTQQGCCIAHEVREALQAACQGQSAQSVPTCLAYEMLAYP